MFRRASLVALIGALFSFAHATPPVTRAAVFVYLYGAKDLTPAKPEYLFKKFERALAADPTITATYLFQARDAAQLRAVIDATEFAPDVRIAKVLVSAHGTSQSARFDGDPHRYLQMTFGDLVLRARNREDRAVEADSGANLEVQLTEHWATFENVRAAMDPRAEVFCTGCQLVSGSEDEAKLKAHALARLFNVRDGRIFANRTDGNLDKLHWRAFWQHDTLQSKLSASSVQVVVGATSVAGLTYATMALVVPPAAVLIEYGYSHWRNQGYTFEFEDRRLTGVTKETATNFSGKFFGRPSCAALLAYARGHVGW